ncbi:Morn repeat protein [Pandoravirus inopinatum]|uniref:Morn repeat protein n=1 Tax=Pandoravirus inopinatum TaxID=1605721 RepID=A0A0B5J1J3_9VIRU|nr:Morn repeat protein [Pandoravirus inopinatum]AJF97374.1 Morn repeat protein [Pandoravirus inopinatum]
MPTQYHELKAKAEVGESLILSGRRCADLFPVIGHSVNGKTTGHFLLVVGRRRARWRAICTRQKNSVYPQPMGQRRHAHKVAGSANKRDRTGGSRMQKRRRRRPLKGNHVTKISGFDWLPDELVLAILVALDDPRSLASWAQTSRRHHSLADDPSLWRRLCELRFGPLLHCNFVGWGKSWRWLYRAQACEAAATGTDVGAVHARVRGRKYIYWGDCRDGLP